MRLRSIRTEAKDARRSRARWNVFGVRLLGLASLLVASGAVAPAAGSGARAASSPGNLPVTVAHLDGTRSGPAFQGIGAISGGGGNSRYLIDYPVRERSAILDYLFKPHYGASLQLLKLEIGGNGNSSDGSEPSVEQVRGQIDCSVGYELWLGEQAVKRNPRIALYGLQWSAPSWVRGTGNSLWTAADIQYLLDWLGCAHHLGLHISYIGGWNEHYVPGSRVIEAWYVALRRALDAHGYRQVKIVAADNYGTSTVWSVAEDMTSNPAFARAVAVIGVHDICGLESHGFHCTSSARARAWAAGGHKVLWQSELGRTPRANTSPLEEGPSGLARSLNNGYLDAGITGTLVWPLVEAMPPDLPFSGRGLVSADQPWSGSYQVSALTWVIAQTTQFAAPGWRVLRGAGGELKGTGTYVTYMAPNRSAWSTVVETSAASSPQRLTFDVRGGLPTRVHVWLTELNGPRKLVDVATVQARHGTFSFRVAPHDLYTFTTTTGASKANGHVPAAPAPKPAPARYVAHADGAGMATYLAPMEGSFQYVGGTLTQTAIGAPVAWSSCDVGYPYAVLGSSSWRRFTVAASVELPDLRAGTGRPGAFLIAGFDGRGTPCDFSGYIFSVDSSGRWKVTRGADLTAVLKSGRVAASRRYTLSLVVSGRELTGSIDGRRVVSLARSSPVGGLAGVGSLTYQPVRYTSLTVR